MAKRPAGVMLTGVKLDRRVRTPLHEQLYQQIRDAIVSAQIRPGARLPSTRVLASELGVSRNTVMDAYSQLFAEGYLDSRIGAGAFVANELPAERLRQPIEDQSQRATTDSGPSLPSRHQALVDLVKTINTLGSGRRVESCAFQVGLPAIDEFPLNLWEKLIRKYAAHFSSQHAGTGHLAGLRPLRTAISDYLNTARGVRCSPDQIVIVRGYQQSISLTAQVVLNPADTVLVEDPGYSGTRGALLLAGAELAPVRVDDEGIVIQEGERDYPSARMACVTATHQFPLGVSLSARRQRDLLAWAHRTRSWILEDSYDAEFHFRGQPPLALQGMDTGGCTIYAGTFNRILFPAVRMGYIVSPPRLVDAFIAARYFSDHQISAAEQMAVAELITDGHFDRHIRRMRQIYAHRRETLAQALQSELGSHLNIQQSDGGNHLVGWLPKGIDDVQISDRAARLGITVMPLSLLTSTTMKRGGIVLGSSGVPIDQIRPAVRRLASVFDAV